MPAYNAAPFIESAIRSALAQDVDLEVIVVDDASTDDTVERIASIRDPRIVILRNERNRGESFSRNRAIAAATAEWCAILDADDLFLPSRLRRLLARAEREPCEMLGDNLVVRHSRQGRDREAFSPALLAKFPRLDAETLIRADRPDMRASFGHMQPMIKRDFLERHGIAYREGMVIGADFVFCLECLLRGARFLIEPTAGYVYRMHDASVTNDPRRKAWAHLGAHASDTVALAQRLGRPDLVPALNARRQMLARFARYRDFADPLRAGDVMSAAQALWRGGMRGDEVLGLLCSAAIRRLTGQRGLMQRASL
jgi:glycosyltransferase involved in cell wall biosynthesis